MSARTTCLECGEELWGPHEAHGLCLLCTRREEADREESERPPESEPYDDWNEGMDPS